MFCCHADFPDLQCNRGSSRFYHRLFQLHMQKHVYARLSGTIRFPGLWYCISLLEGPAFLRRLAAVEYHPSLLTAFYYVPGGLHQSLFEASLHKIKLPLFATRFCIFRLLARAFTCVASTNTSEGSTRLNL